MVTFSIVITTYNRLPLLQRAIESALAQTIPCEIIVVDDCSTDGTLDYLRNLGKKINFTQSKSNLGHSISVNQGVNLSQAIWIKLLDDDDYLAPNCLEVMEQAIIRHPQAVICSCQAVQVNEENVEIGRTRYLGQQHTIANISQADIHYRMLIEHLPFGTPAQVAFRKDAFLQSGGWDSSFDLDYDDIDSWVRIALLGDALLINQYLTYRTLWEGGYNQKFSLQERLQTNIAIKEKIYTLVHEKYRDSLPPFSDFQNYLKLHWGLVALKNRQVVTAFKIAFWAILSCNAWKLLFKARF